MEEDYIKRNVNPVLSAATLPTATILRRGPLNLRSGCFCSVSDYHVSYFDYMIHQYAKEWGGELEPLPVDDFCENTKSFLNHRLPCWATGLRTKKEFRDLPKVKNVFNLFERGTYWWHRLNMNENGRLSREARALLLACTNVRPGYISTEDLLQLDTDPVSMSRVKNWFSTLDGLLISIYLGSQGREEILNWDFFDSVMQTYLKNAVTDLFKKSEEDTTYYSDLKDCRGEMKDNFLKEGNYKNLWFKPQFWYFNAFIELFNLNTSVQTPMNLKTIAYITQTRACGLPPEPVKKQAMKKFFDIARETPQKPSREAYQELCMAAIEVADDIRYDNIHFNALFNRAMKETKISLSNSSSFLVPRSQGGKSEAARRILCKLDGIEIPIYDLHTGRIDHLHKVSKDTEYIAEVLFHYSIAMANYERKNPPNDKTSGITDVRVSIVEEPGKARVITIPRVEHSILLHPLAHILSTLIASIPSSRTGMKASNHMWDTLKRFDRQIVALDGIHRDQWGLDNPRSTFLCSEDWTSATDSMNPFSASIFLRTFCFKFNLPQFYTDLAIDMLISPRRIYDESILLTARYENFLCVKKSGIFQGDPLCKQTLHLAHNVSRKSAINSLVRIGSRVQSRFNNVLYGTRVVGPIPIQRSGPVDRNLIRNFLEGKGSSVGQAEREKSLFSELRSHVEFSYTRNEQTT